MQVNRAMTSLTRTSNESIPVIDFNTKNPLKKISSIHKFEPCNNRSLTLKYFIVGLKLHVYSV